MMTDREPQELEGRVTAITGAASGLGAAIARQQAMITYCARRAPELSRRHLRINCIARRHGFAVVLAAPALPRRSRPSSSASPRLAALTMHPDHTNRSAASAQY
jgi:NAD(P)-dependent dehydrogenase (short-subunit alcohol dehydrogenase family)